MTENGVDVTLLTLAELKKFLVLSEPTQKEVIGSSSSVAQVPEVEA